MSVSNSISGSIINFSSISSASTELSAQSTCVGQLATLYSLDSQGKKGPKLLESAVDDSGNFSFRGVRNLGIDVAIDTGATKYLIEFSCGSLSYQRFVTGALDQKLSYGTTLMSWVSQTDASASIRTQSSQNWAEFYQTLESAGSVTAAFSALNSNTTLKTQFQTLFGVVPDVLNEAVPIVKTTVVPSLFNEEAGQAMSVQATHWSSTYNIAYAWKIGSSTLSNASNFTYTPSANTQGSHTIQLFIGQNNGSGGIDTTKPYTQETFPITIQNSVPPSAPAISRVTSQYTTSLSATVRIATGALIDGRPQNCKSFSKLALVEESFPGGIAPLLSSSYDIDCTTANNQDVNVILSGTEGIRVLRIWARDEAGNISSISQDVSVVLDRVSPSLTLTSLDGGQTVRGGGVAAITWTATELNPATNPIHLEYSTNSGSTWTSIASSVANSGTYSWIVPSVNSSSVKVRISMLDLAGNSGSTQSSSVFTIDSTAPTAPVIARSSNQYSNSTTVDLAVTCDSDYSGIFLSNSSTAPLSTDSGWAACSASMNYSVATGDGTKTIYAYSKDAVGNVSSSNSVTMTLDQTAPSLSIATTLTGPYKGGASLSFQFSVTELNITTSQSFTLSYTTDNGSTWTTLGTIPSTNGPLSTQSFIFSLTWPSVDSSQVKIKVSATDRAGNSNAVISNAVTVDSTAPSFTSLSSAQGAAVAQPFVVLNSTVSDVVSTNASLQMQIRDGASAPEASLWETYSSSKGFSFGYVQGAHILNIYVRDEVGNVAQSSISVTLDSGTPPILRILSPAEGASMPAGSDQTLSLHIHDIESVMPANSVAVAYSVDNGSTWADFGSTYTPYSNSSTLTDETLSVVWANVPGTVTGKAVRFRITASDAAGNTVKSISNFFNSSSLRRIAGGVSDQNGVSAKFTMLNTQEYFNTTILNRFVRDPMTNDFFLGDLNQGLRYINGATGVINIASLAGGSHAMMTRDNYGNIYGCNATGIYKFDRLTLSWVSYLAQPCDNIAAWRNYQDRLYFVRNFKLYYFDGSAVTWVAFNGTQNSLALPSAYALDPADSKTGVYPKVSVANQFAVDNNGNVFFTDNCYWHGNVVGCPSNLRLLTYNRVSGKVTASAETYFRSNLFFRYFNNQLIGVSGGMYDEDPLTGALFYYGVGQVKQYANNLTFNAHFHLGNTPQSETYLTALIAGQLADSGDNNLATLAHLNLPTHLFVGHPGSADADAIFVPKGNGCCFQWGAIRRFTVDGNITNFGNQYSYTRSPVTSPAFASTAQGYLSWRGQAVKSNSTTVSNLWGNTTTCTLSPTDGVSASTNNWPYFVSYASNYGSGLHHSDGYVYLAGFRNTTSGSTCTGTADIFIKRFSFNNTTNAVGTVEHVAGATGAPAGAEPTGTGQDASTFGFGSLKVGLMRENRNAGASGNIFFIQGNRIRVLERVNPSSPATWKVYDVTKNISGIREFVIDSGVNGLGTTGYLYYVTGDSNIYRYHLGSGTAALTDDTVAAISPGGLTGLTITSIDILSNGRIVFTDNKANGAVFEYIP